MTRNNFLEYIQRETKRASQRRYSDPRLQCLYELGLTQRILAECMYSDNLASGIFQSRIQAVLDQS